MNVKIYNQLKELKPILKERFGIEEFAIFGSVAKGTDTKDSDVDIAILQMNLKSGFDVINAQYYLKEQLNKNIDIGSFKAMKTFIKNRIKKDFIYV
jgi:predicted nucleotidyltransferase